MCSREMLPSSLEDFLATAKIYPMNHDTLTLKNSESSELLVSF